MLGLPALPTPTILPSRIPTSALITPRIGSRTVTLVMTISRQPAAWVSWLSGPMPSRKVLPPPYWHLVAEGAQVLLDLDEEVGIAQADPVPDGRSVEVRVLLPRKFRHGQLHPSLCEPCAV